jgi:hypothetical protein
MACTVELVAWSHGPVSTHRLLLLLLLLPLLLILLSLPLSCSTLWNNPQLSGCLPASWAGKGSSGKGKRLGGVTMAMKHTTNEDTNFHKTPRLVLRGALRHGLQLYVPLIPPPLLAVAC